MNTYAEFKQIIRDEGKYYNPPSIIIGRYKTTHIEADGHKLKRDDCLLASHLLFDDEEYWLYSQNDKESSLVRYGRNLVKDGDMLAMYFCEEKNKYIVLAKVVST